MKFKYNFLARKLYKLQAEYTCEVSEENYFRTHGMYSWSLGNQERITFTPFFYNCQVCYRKGNVDYQKTLDLPVNGELIFEFTEQDRITHEQKT